MDVKEAVRIAKAYIYDVLGEEQISNLGVEETEQDPQSGLWKITLGFSRPWNIPRTRAQEVLERLGAVTSLRRTYKVISVSLDAVVLSMKDRLKFAEAL